MMKYNICWAYAAGLIFLSHQWVISKSSTGVSMSEEL